MTFRNWLLLLGVMTAVGMLKVAEETSVCVKAYALGRQYRAEHALESETWWLQTKVAGLESPVRLADTLQQPRKELVAWSTLPGSTSPASYLVRLSQLLGASE